MGSCTFANNSDQSRAGAIQKKSRLYSGGTFQQFVILKLIRHVRIVINIQNYIEYLVGFSNPTEHIAV